MTEEKKPPTLMHTVDDVEKYYRFVYRIVNNNKTVAKQDRLDISHNAIAKLQSMDKVVNFSYILQVTRNEIKKHRQKKHGFTGLPTNSNRDFNNRQYVNTVQYDDRIITESLTDSKEYFEFSYDDLQSLPIGKVDKDFLLEYYQDGAVEMAKSRGCTKRAIYIRRQRILEKLKKRLEEKNRLGYNEYIDQ